MNNELYARAGQVASRIKDLRENMHNCKNAIEEIEHGADIRILGNYLNINISGCCLDDGQEKLMQDMLVTIMKNRIEEAEAELMTLLPKDILPPPMK